MVDKKENLQRMFGLAVVTLMVIGLFSPIFATGIYLNEKTMDEGLTSDDVWVIDGVTRYINVSGDMDHSILIRNGGRLNINNATISLLIDQYNPHRITVETGGSLMLWNSMVETRLRGEGDESLLRPFLKTNITARSGSTIMLRENSAFTFPGWVYIEDSTLIMQNSKFDRVAEIPGILDYDDNDDCPRLTAAMGSKIVIEDSVINNYYSHSNTASKYQTWDPNEKGLGDTTGEPLARLINPNEYYTIEPGETMDIASWYLEPFFRQDGLEEYINPTNILKNLYIEIVYRTELGYVGDDYVMYDTPSAMKQAMRIVDTSEVDRTDRYGIWEVDPSTFYRDGDYFFKDLQLLLENSDLSRNISVRSINLISAYDNSINIWDSEMVVINSFIDVDYHQSEPSLDPTRTTNQDTYMMDYNPHHRVIRLLDSSLKAYGLYPAVNGVAHEPPSDGDGDPIIIADEASHNRTWIYRWLTVTPKDAEGAPLTGANVTAELDTMYREIFPFLYDNVMNNMDPANNPEALDYIERHGMGTYDEINEHFVTNEQGHVTMFMLSDRINHPRDWPNSRFVGDYYLNVSHAVLGDISHDISMPAFPLMNETVTNIHKEIIYDATIPLPDLTITEDDLVFYVDTVSVGYITTGTEIEIEVTVHNIGDKDAEDVEVRFSYWKEDTVWPDDVVEIAVTIIPSLPMGENETTSVLYTFNDEGEYYINAFADPENKIIERNIGNNDAWKRLLVGEKPDLAVGYVYTLPSSPIMNTQDASIYFGVENRGGTDAHDVLVEISYYDGVATTIIDQMVIDTLEGNWSFVDIGPVDWNYPGPGEYDIIVEVDPLNETEEGDYTNNVMSISVTVLEEPDLIPRNFQLGETEIHDGKILDIEIQVENIGEWTSRSTYVSFYVDWGTPDQQLIDVKQVPSLTGGAISGLIQTSWTARLVDPNNMVETRTITARVNYPAMEDRETDFTNNWANDTIDVMNPADLSVSADEIEFSELLPEINSPVDITAIVHNHGGEEVTTTVRFVTDEGNLDTVITIGSLGSEEATVTWTPATRGYRTVTVIVDPNNEVYELNKENNVASVTQPIFSENLQFDLIVNDANSPQTRGTFKCSGFVVVMESADLYLHGNSHAIFEMVQSWDNQYGIIVMDQGYLEINRTILFSEYNVNVDVMDEGTLNIIEDSMIYNMVSINTHHDTEFTVHDSRVEGPLHVSGENFHFSESTFTSTNIMVSPSNIEGMNSTFNGALNDLHDTIGRLTAVRTTQIAMTGTSNIEIYRWWHVTTVSYGEILMSGSEIEIDSLMVDYSASGVTGVTGDVYLPVLTDILTATTNNFIGNYEITGTYSEKGSTFVVGPSSIALPGYPTDQHVIRTTLVFQDLRIPDLYITDERITTPVDIITSGENLRISALVGNIGHSDAEDVNVRFYLVIPDEDERLIGTTSLSSVPMNEYVTASIVWEAEMLDDTLKQEELHIRVFVDPDVMPLSDANVGNNYAETTITVRSPPHLEFLLPDMEIHVDGSAIENDTAMERDELTIHTAVVNNGGTDLFNASVEVYFDDIVLYSEIMDMPIDERINITVNWEAIVSGIGEITIFVNSSLDTVESIYQFREIAIEEMFLRFANIQIPLEDQRMGETILVSAALERTDGKPIRNMVVEVYLVDSNDQVVASTTSTTGANGNFNAQFITPERSGVFTIRLRPVHENGELVEVGSFRVIGEEKAGIPWWILLIAVIAAAGSVGGVILYLKYKGEGEWVECGACGATIPAESTECPNCNTEFEMDTVKCSECGEWIPSESDSCPHCGAEFITTGVAMEEYKETMTQQYEKFVEKHRHKAKGELGEEFTEEEFMNWWMTQPSYLTFDDWLEQEEERRRRGGIECKECGSLNPVDEAICQKCGSSLVLADKAIKKEQPPKRELKPKTQPEETPSKPDTPPTVVKKVVKAPEEDKPSEPKTPQPVVKKVKKQPKKVAKKVKKKVKRPGEDE